MKDCTGHRIASFHIIPLEDLKSHHIHEYTCMKCHGREPKFNLVGCDTPYPAFGAFRYARRRTSRSRSGSPMFPAQRNFCTTRDKSQKQLTHMVVLDMRHKIQKQLPMKHLRLRTCAKPNKVQNYIMFWMFD